MPVHLCKKECLYESFIQRCDEAAIDSVVTRSQTSRGTLLSPPGPVPGAASSSAAFDEVDSTSEIGRMDQTPKKDEQAQQSQNTGEGTSSEDIRSEFRSMAESRLQGILKSFGRVEELFNVGQSTGKRIKDIIENLNSQDINKIRLATDDLNNLLNNTAEDAYSTFPIDQLMPALVRCMSFDEDFDVTLKAIRCLGTFARSLPSSCNSMVNHGAVPALCTRLLAMEVIDVAEESIRAIKYISKECPEACLTNGALCAALSFLDFFSLHERRDAVESAAYMCRGLKSENCALVIDQVPTLVNLLGYEDAALVEKAALALLRVCEASVENPDILDSLSSTELVGKSLELISGASVSPMKSSTFFGLIKILTLCAGNNTKIAEMLLENSISEILHSLFASSASGWRPGSISGPIQTPEYLSLILQLTESLLPKEQADENSTSLRGFFEENPELVAKFGGALLPVLLKVHDVTISQPVRAKVLLIWSKVVKIMDKSAFQSVVNNLKISSLLGPLLTSSQDEIVLQAMALVEALMMKIPEKFRKDFLREGVVHAISQLASNALDSSVSHEFLKGVHQAQRFLEMHFSGFSLDHDSDGVHQLKIIAMNLQVDEISKTSLTHLLHLINEEGISTFEFLRSSIVEALNIYLKVEDPCQVGVRDTTSSSGIDPEHLLTNVRALVEIGLSSLTQDRHSPLQGLVHKLQEAVSATENFPVRHVVQRNVRNPGPSSKSGSDELKAQNLRLASLGQPLKLKLERGKDEKELKELPQSQVLVEPLVVIHALEEYLWPRVKLNENSTPSSVPSATATSHPSQVATETHERSSSSSRRDHRMSHHHHHHHIHCGGSRSSGMIRRPKFQTPTKSSSLRLNRSPDSEALSFSHDESEGGGIFHDDDLIIDGDEEEEELEEISDEDELDEEEDDEEDDDMESLSRALHLDPNSEVDELDESAGQASSSSANERSYAQLMEVNAPGLSEIEFCIGDVVIKPQATVFQAIRESIAMKIGYEDELEGESTRISTFRQKWEEIHTISYRKRQIRVQDHTTSTTSASVLSATDTHKQTNNNHHVYAKCSKLNMVLSKLQRVSIPEELNLEPNLRQILLLMKMLDAVSGQALRFQDRDGDLMICPLSRTEFISSKLSTKLSQQIQDPLTICSSSAPSWTKNLVISCKFLFPFELRRKFFYCRLGAPRALLFFNKEYEATGERKESLKVERGDHGEVRLSKLKSSKVRVSRSKILSTAMKIMDAYAHITSEVIEVQYYNESGVGEGPTLEFYTLVSQELQERYLDMWRDDGKTQSMGTNIDVNKRTDKIKSSFVNASNGLFPKPYAPGHVPSKVLRLFTFMGRTVARALIDGRLMDLNINPLFFHILRGEPVDLYDIYSIDSHLGSILEKLQAAVDHQPLEHAYSNKIVVDGVELEELCLPYTLPGYEDYPLNGKERGGGLNQHSSTTEFVDDENVQKYIDSVVKGTLSEGIESQMHAFEDGFQSVLPLEMLEIFYDDELDLLLRGTHGNWTVEELSECVHFSHGYSPLCDQARWFLEILAELDDSQRRSFLQFLTGSPRLPPGGIGALSPQLTVVQRLNNNTEGGASENDLPSVATCVNFLKLPKYGSKQVMKDRLIIAFNEGQYAFDLS